MINGTPDSKSLISLILSLVHILGEFRAGAEISACFCCLCEILLSDPAESDSASSSDSGEGSSSNASASGSESEDSEGGSESDGEEEEEEDEDEKEKKKKKKKEFKKPFQESERLNLLLCDDDGPRSDWRMWIQLNDFFLMHDQRQKSSLRYNLGKVNPS